MPDRLIKIQEAMRIFGVSRTTLWRLERDGKIPRRRKVGNVNAWFESEINEWLEQLKNQQVTTVQPPSIRIASHSPSRKTSSATLPSATATFNATPFINALGIQIPAWLAEQIHATVDATGNLQYGTAAYGSVCCAVTASIDPRSVLVEGGGSFTIAGDQNTDDWVVVESLADLLRLLNADNNQGQGYLILNKPKFVKRAAIYLGGKRVCLMLGRDEEGDKLTATLLNIISGSTDMRGIFPE